MGMGERMGCRHGCLRHRRQGLVLRDRLGPFKPGQGHSDRKRVWREGAARSGAHAQVESPTQNHHRQVVFN
ncbi:hypothetical protein SARC_13811, partial [Sphaeroforma arctica JP610]